MSAGYSSGWQEGSYNKKFVCVELLCKARGDDFDRFIAAPPENIEKAIDDYFDKHPEVKAKNIKYSIPGFLKEEFQNIELKKKTKDLEKMNQIMIDRELKMIELKKQLNKSQEEVAELKRNLT